MTNKTRKRQSTLTEGLINKRNKLPKHKTTKRTKRLNIRCKTIKQNKNDTTQTTNTQTNEQPNKQTTTTTQTNKTKQKHTRTHKRNNAQ